MHISRPFCLKTLKIVTQFPRICLVTPLSPAINSQSKNNKYISLFQHLQKNKKRLFSQFESRNLKNMPIMLIQTN
ncbi:hypothetical protein BpHYR1_003896 [Brachionus plicatilis]|uniref:Uncharacterized protein n=1 Tax=Brachionus plicatilis TaxID=10195 RepID=A0A3M7PIH1_BRAPC|nr:hypothetical protein BpHYR1_003896 [Brachionus plicatilis]